MTTEVNDKKTTHVVGNTKRQRVMARAFQLTINEPDKYCDIKKYITGLKTFKYMISCKEKAPTTGHEHMHIYCHFDAPIGLSLKKTLGAHIEKCRGSPKQNIDYIKKDGNIIDEIGEIPKQGQSIKTVKEMTKEERETLDIKYYNIIEKINTKENNDINIDDIFKPNIKVYYIYGDSGVGKTKKAMELFKENNYSKINMVKYENGFWNGIGSSNACLYDDFRDSHMKPSEFINFIDYNKHQLNVKGGYELNNYEFIIITSVQNPEEIYSNVQGEPRKQWIRRLNIIHLINL